MIKNFVAKCYYVLNCTMFDRNKGLQIKMKIVEIKVTLTQVVVGDPGVTANHLTTKLSLLVTETTPK